jgi:hypothetical protein
MLLAYYDIFSFFLLIVVGVLIKEKKKAVLILLGLSFLLVLVSAYFFYTGYVSFENEFYLDLDHGSLNGDGRETEVLGGKPYGLYIGLFLIVWIIFYSFSFLISRGIRSAYLRFFKKDVNLFQGEER